MALREKVRRTRSRSRGMQVAGCLHVTKETAVLIRTLRAAGAEVSWSGCNPLSTQDDVAAALAAEGTSIYAWHGLSKEEFYWCIEQTLEFKPTLTLDDGADLIFTRARQAPGAGQGRHRRHRGDHHRRAPPARDGRTTASCSTRSSPSTTARPSGTSTTSTAPASRRSTASCAPRRCCSPARPSSSPATATAAAASPSRAKGMGANVIVTEIKPTAALKATLDGFRVMTMDEAAKIGDIFITATGMKDIIVGRHFDVMKDGALVCNTGHYDCEINLGRPRGARRRASARSAHEQRGVRAQGRPPHLRAGAGPPRQPGRRRGPPVGGHGHVVRQPVPGAVKLAKEGKSMKPASTSCRPSRIRSWRASS